MNDEIREILDYLKNDDYSPVFADEGCDDTPYKLFDEIEVKLLLDYITNLQQENEELNKMCELYSKSLYCAELTDYKSRIKKAVDYIKEHIRIDDEYPAYMEMLIEERDNLLNILNGENDKSKGE